MKKKILSLVIVFIMSIALMGEAHSVNYISGNITNSGIASYGSGWWMSGVVGFRVTVYNSSHKSKFSGVVVPDVSIKYDNRNFHSSTAVISKPIQKDAEFSSKTNDSSDSSSIKFLGELNDLSYCEKDGKSTCTYVSIDDMIKGNSFSLLKSLLNAINSNYKDSLESDDYVIVEPLLEIYSNTFRTKTYCHYAACSYSCTSKTDCSITNGTCGDDRDHVELPSDSVANLTECGVGSSCTVYVYSSCKYEESASASTRYFLTAYEFYANFINNNSNFGCGAAKSFNTCYSSVLTDIGKNIVFKQGVNGISDISNTNGFLGCVGNSKGACGIGVYYIKDTDLVPNGTLTIHKVNSNGNHIIGSSASFKVVNEKDTSKTYAISTDVGDGTGSISLPEGAYYISKETSVPKWYNEISPNDEGKIPFSFTKGGTIEYEFEIKSGKDIEIWITNQSTCESEFDELRENGTVSMTDRIRLYNKYSHRGLLNMNNVTPETACKAVTCNREGSDVFDCFEGTITSESYSNANTDLSCYDSKISVNLSKGTATALCFTNMKLLSNVSFINTSKAGMMYILNKDNSITLPMFRVTNKDLATFGKTIGIDYYNYTIESVNETITLNKEIGALTTLDFTCYIYRDPSALSTENSPGTGYLVAPFKVGTYDNYLGAMQINSENYTLGLSLNKTNNQNYAKESLNDIYVYGQTNTSDDAGWFARSETILVNNYLKKVYSKNISGEIEKTDYDKNPICSTCRFLGYGDISLLNTKEGNHTITPKFFYKLDKNSNTFVKKDGQCYYNIEQDFIRNDKMQVEFRIIDINNPFPGKIGTGRNTGSNWCYIDKEGKKNCDNSYCTIREDGTKDCKTNGNNIVDSFIINSNDSKNSLNRQPMYSIELTPDDIGAIRIYNRENKYDDYKMECDSDGLHCKSTFLSDLQRGIVTTSTQTYTLSSLLERYSPLLGDVNLDGRVTSEDASYINFYTIYGPANYPLTEIAKKNADVNGDGKIDIDDTVWIINSLSMPTITGDVDGDGEVTDADEIRLARYISGWDVNVTPGADINGDGKINSKDLVLLQRMLAG